MKMSFPNKETRQICYNARDKFWECLDANNEQLEVCKKFRQEYEKVCSGPWVKHFDRKRAYEKFKTKDDADGLTPEQQKPIQ